jgi:hypothetical protein
MVAVAASLGTLVGLPLGVFLATSGRSGTVAALVPIEVPAISRVNGMIATTRMMNGVERVALTTRGHPRHAADGGGRGLAGHAGRPAARRVPRHQRAGR